MFCNLILGILFIFNALSTALSPLAPNSKIDAMLQTFFFTKKFFSKKKENISFFNFWHVRFLYFEAVLISCVFDIKAVPKNSDYSKKTEKSVVVLFALPFVSQAPLTLPFRTK